MDALRCQNQVLRDELLQMKCKNLSSDANSHIENLDENWRVIANQDRLMRDLHVSLCSDIIPQYK